MWIIDYKKYLHRNNVLKKQKDDKINFRVFGFGEKCSECHNVDLHQIFKKEQLPCIKLL